MNRTIFCETHLGCLKVVFDDKVVIEISFADSVAAEISGDCAVSRQLKEYFSGRRCAFTFSWSMRGTPFQCMVWQELCKIPYGETRTYGDVAKALGMPGASRAVGRACNSNPLLLLVPCHRVVGAGGKMTGFAAGIERKRVLLDMEQQVLHKKRTRM